MSAILRLPPELVEFNLREPPRSLLIRGEPGTGKSSLALTLLSLFRGKRVYVSSRVTRVELERDYPWLRTDAEGAVEILESFSLPRRIDAQGRILEKTGDILTASRNEAILEQLWLPEALTDAYSRIQPGHPGMVVIDSWDALVEQYVGLPAAERVRFPDRGEIERLLLGMMGRGQVHLVLVVERDVPTQLDYLVDGVVVCSSVTEDSRLERWTHLKKMRGVRVDHPWYPFTLEDGRFLCIAPMAPNYAVKLRPPQPEPDHQPGLMWPGSNDFATQFGRLPLGRVTLIETDPEVPTGAVRLLYAPALSQVALTGGRIVHVLPPSVLPEDIWSAYGDLLSPEQFVSTVRLFSATGLGPDSPHGEMLEKVLLVGPSPNSEATGSRMPQAFRFLREGRGSQVPNLAVAWLSGLRAAGGYAPDIYTPETFPAILQHTLALGTTHVILVGGTSDPLLVGVREMAPIRIRMKAKNGRVFVEGMQPVTPTLVLTQSDNATPFRLTRVV